MRVLIVCFFVLFFITIAKSQDVHLTQYYTSNLLVNPAYTGSYDGDIKITANIRSQWGQVNSPIKTNILSIEKKILRFPDEFGAGIMFANDFVSAYYLKTNKVLLSGSYQKNIRNNLVRFGLQGGMVFRSIDLSGQSFPDQWNYQAGTFDKSLPSNQPTLVSSHNYLSLNVGVGWMRKFNKSRVAAGYALFNTNRPDDGFFPEGKGLPFRHVFNSSLTHPVSEKVSLIPHLQYMYTVKATDFMIGANSHIQVVGNLGLLAGLAYRTSQINRDAVLGMVGGTYKRFQLGFSMDFNVSELSKDARNKTAWEISLIYLTPGRIPNKVTIPCDRY